jgi:hypothetical protein
MTASCERLCAEGARLDPLRRLLPTSLAADLPTMGRTIRLETNSPLILDRTQRLFARYAKQGTGSSEFRWRIVCESSSGMRPPWPEVLGFSDSGLRFVSFGQRNFLAIDLLAKEAIGYIAHELLADEAGFVSPFLNTLFSLTAGALRLTPLAGACVTLGGQALVILGKPNSGKTTSSYLAARLELEFYSDASVFLDLEADGLRLWGDFSPASFRPETIEFLPELRDDGQPFHYRDMTFLYVEKGTAISGNGYPVTPVACVFLERGTATSPRLTSIGHAACREALQESLSFRDDQCFAARHAATLYALARLPAYRLSYKSDPAVAATFFKNILEVHRSLEATQ